MDTEWYLEATDYAPQGRAGYPILLLRRPNVKEFNSG